MISPQLKHAVLVDRIEQKDDHVLMYIKEVRGSHSGECQMRTSRSVRSCHLSLCPQLLSTISINYSLELVQQLAVQNLKPAVVTMYDYYQTSKQIHNPSICY